MLVKCAARPFLQAEHIGRVSKSYLWDVEQCASCWKLCHNHIAIPQSDAAVPGDAAKTAGIVRPGIQEIHVRRIMRGRLMCGGVMGVISTYELSISLCTNVQGMPSFLSLPFEPLQRPGVRGITAGL